MTSENTLTTYSNLLIKHQTFLMKFNTFPTATRKAIYLQLLQLPLNHSHFIELTKPYPVLPEHTIDKQVAFIVSAFTRLYPDLNNQWLPGLIHPFAMLFKEDAIVCFELSLTMLLNWLLPVFNDHPNPSKLIMAFCSKHLRKLETKVNSLDYPLSAILNPSLLVVLTDILTKQQSLEMLDFLISHPYSPEYLICILVSIIRKIEHSLSSLESIEAISLALRSEKKLLMKDIFIDAINLSKNDQYELAEIYNNVKFPLPKTRYPYFQFIKLEEIPRNKILDQFEEPSLDELKDKFNKLASLIQSKLHHGSVSNTTEITDKYKQAEGQMLQYLKQMHQEHANKLQALEELENEFKINLYNIEHTRKEDSQKNIDAIERRGRIEKQIVMAKKEAEKVREAEQAMMRRIEEIVQIRKEELMKENIELKKEQKLRSILKL